MSMATNAGFNPPSTLLPAKKQQLYPTAQSGTDETPTRRQLWQWCLRADAVAQCYIRDVMVLRESEKNAGRDQDTFWWLRTVPCRSVQFVGIVVGARAFERRTIYTVDDGTGAIQCVHPHAARDQRQSTTHKPTTSLDIPEPLYDIGDIVRVAGRVQKWQDTFQISVDNLEMCRPNDEPDHWLATAKLHETYYAQPFVIPPLPPPPPPITPVKRTSQVVLTTPSTVTTVATPSTAASTSAPFVPDEGPVRLRHPSRLHSKELISSTFKIYLKNYMDVLSDPSWTILFSLSQRDDYPESPTKRLRSSHHNEDIATPRPKDKRSRMWQEGAETPRPSHRDGKENVLQPSRPRRQKGFTLSYLRRVPELADMAFRVVEAEAKRRARETRHKLKEAERTGKSQKLLETTQAPTESASRKAKRLYTWALRDLYREGSIMLHEDDAPVWEISSAASETRGVWKPRKAADPSADADGTSSSIRSDLTGRTLVAEDRGELSDPPAREESYIPLTPALLTEPIMDTIGSMMTRRLEPRRGGAPQTGLYRTSHSQSVGPTVEELREHMGKCDARWENLSEYVVADALQLLKAQDRVYKVGNGRWEISL